MSQTQHWTDFPNAPAVGTPLIAFSALVDGAVTMCDVAAVSLFVVAQRRSGVGVCQRLPTFWCALGTKTRAFVV